MRRVYIAGRLSSKEKNGRNPSKVVTDYIANLSTMCKVASKVRKMGHYPYVPGLDFMLGVVNGDWEEDMYREIGMSFLEVCDMMLVTSHSWGVDFEIDRAKELHIPYLDISDFTDRLINGDIAVENSVRIWLEEE